MLSDGQLADEILKLTDWFTDELFGCKTKEGDTVIVFPVSRLVVDPERFLDDKEEPMAKVGMGVVYTKSSTGSALRGKLTTEEHKLLIDTYYFPHHKRLSDAVDEELRRTGRAVIVDCHSFPSKPLPYEHDQNPERPDICIGADEFHTPEWILQAVESCCHTEGLSFAVNRPFAGSIVPLEHFRTNNNVLTIMIEINRKQYMNEKTGERSHSFDSCRQRVERMIAVIRKVDADRF
jgi:N-formylglutamate deformylase